MKEVGVGAVESNCINRNSRRGFGRVRMGASASRLGQLQGRGGGGGICWDLGRWRKEGGGE